MKTSELIEDRKFIATQYQKWVYMFFEMLIKNLRSAGIIHDIKSANPILLYPTKKHAKKFYQISIEHTNVMDICTLIKNDNTFVKWKEAHQLFTIDIQRHRSYGCKFIVSIDDNKDHPNCEFIDILPVIRYIYKDKPEDLSPGSTWLCRNIYPIIDKTISEFSKMRDESWERYYKKRGNK